MNAFNLRALDYVHNAEGNISKDHFILDGHHRWAGLLAWDFMDGFPFWCF